MSVQASPAQSKRSLVSTYSFQGTASLCEWYQGGYPSHQHTLFLLMDLCRNPCPCAHWILTKHLPCAWPWDPHWVESGEQNRRGTLISEHTLLPRLLWWLLLYAWPPPWPSPPITTRLIFLKSSGPDGEPCCPWVQVTPYGLAFSPLYSPCLLGLLHASHRYILVGPFATAETCLMCPLSASARASPSPESPLAQQLLPSFKEPTLSVLQEDTSACFSLPFLQTTTLISFPQGCMGRYAQKVLGSSGLRFFCVSGTPWTI